MTQYVKNRVVIPVEDYNMHMINMGAILDPSIANYVNDTYTWIAKNPESFQKLIQICLKAKRSGIKRIRRGDVAMLASLTGIEIDNTDRFKFNNNMWSVLARIVLSYHPELKEVIKLRRSQLDFCVLPEFTTTFAYAYCELNNHPKFSDFLDVRDVFAYAN